jgi:hypothetical protein
MGIMTTQHRAFFAGLCALAMLLTGSAARAAVVTLTAPVTDPATGARYQLLSNANWTDSEAAAEALGGHLATTANAEQQNFVFSTFGALGGVQRILWIGLSDPSQDANGGAHASNFKWADGQPVTYTNWDIGEPNLATSTEFYAAMYYPQFRNPGSWNDWDNRTADPIGIGFYGVVQLPEPTTTTAFGAMLLVPLARRRRSRARA